MFTVCYVHFKNGVVSRETVAMVNKMLSNPFLAGKIEKIVFA